MSPSELWRLCNSIAQDCAFAITAAVFNFSREAVGVEGTMGCAIIAASVQYSAGSEVAAGVADGSEFGWEAVVGGVGCGEWSQPVTMAEAVAKAMTMGANRRMNDPRYIAKRDVNPSYCRHLIGDNGMVDPQSDVYSW